MNVEREKVRWACRRGMLECDLFLVPFFEHCYDHLHQAEQENFKRLLVESDTDLFTWLMETDIPPHGEYVSILDKIRAFKRNHTQP